MGADVAGVLPNAGALVPNEPKLPVFWAAPPNSDDPVFCWPNAGADVVGVCPNAGALVALPPNEKFPNPAARKEGKENRLD